jgi:hypothetical protein
MKRYPDVPALWAATGVDAKRHVDLADVSAADG